MTQGLSVTITPAAITTLDDTLAVGALSVQKRTRHLISNMDNSERIFFAYRELTAAGELGIAPPRTAYAHTIDPMKDHRVSLYPGSALWLWTLRGEARAAISVLEEWT